MQNRIMTARNNSFSNWLNDQKSEKSDSGNGNNANESVSLWFQLGSIQESFVTQLQDISGSLPEAGPLSASFRARLIQAIYLLGAAVGFGILTIFIGIPSLLLRPSKFVLCLTLSTLLAASSVIVIQTPSKFLASLLAGGLSQSFPVILLGISQLLTLYTTIFVHKYIYVLVAGGFQVFCLLLYLASFIPGGMKGLEIILRMGYTLLITTLQPCFFIVRKTIASYFQ